MRDAFSEAIGLTNVVDPRQRPAPRQRPGSSPRRRRRRNTRRPKDAFEEAITPVAPQQQAEPAQQAPETPVEQAPAAPGIDFDAPVPDVRKAIDALPKEQQQAALDEWAKRYVAKEREGGGIIQTATDRLRDVARGTPVGSWLDEANAVTSDALHSVGLGGAPYRESVAYQRARDKAADNESTKLGTLPLVGDVHTSGLTKLAGGLLSAPVSPVVNVLRGGTILPQIGNAMATGTAYGALYGAGEGDSAEDRLKNAGVGSAVGAGMGLAAPLVMSGAKAGINAMRPKIAPKAVRKFHKGAVDRVTRGVKDDFSERSNMMRSYDVERARLGPDGMLADMGPNLRGQAEGIANQPGAGQRVVTSALRSRDRGAQARIDKVADEALGPAQDLAAKVDEVVSNTRKNAGPLYDEFRNTEVTITPDLRRIMRRVRALLPGIDDEIATVMVADDVPLDVIENKGVVLDAMKKALDSAAKRWSGQEANANKARIASNLAKELRNSVDKVLNHSNPKESIYARARAESGRGKQFEQGVKEGKDVLDDKISLGQFRIDNKRRTDPNMAGVQMGAREEVRRKMATAKSAFDDTSQLKAGATAGRRLLSSQETRGKLNEITSPTAARDLVRTLDAEGRMAGTSSAIQGNSATARRQAGQKEFPNAVEVDAGKAANELGKKNLTGLAMESVYRVANFVLDGALDERRLMIAEDAAEMLVAQGNTRDDIAFALVELAQKQVKSEAQREAIMKIARNVAKGGTPLTSREAITQFQGSPD